MNEERRKKLAAIKDKLEDAASALQEVLDEEQEAFDNLPEGIKESEKGEQAENVISSLDNAGDNIASAVSDIEDASA